MTSPTNISSAIPPPEPRIAFDWTTFGHHLEQSDLSEDQKREFIETLWSIILAFVDLGFGIAPQDRVVKDGGQVLDLAKMLSDLPASGARLSSGFDHEDHDRARRHVLPTGDEGRHR
ncbi:hypothetical protein [Pseudoroseicyclus sp. CXY001]|uniref:hypothetical protein n=1 Tax=Pseudoroseicyclus sp. CXY001 TaxID=3242492 RepID=UPI00357131BE